MKRESDDPRVARTLEAIDRTFREMVLENGINGVTVRALCQRARVNKNTFYRYYGAIEDLAADVMAEYSDQWRERRNYNVTDAASAKAATRELFLFGAAQDELYEVITCDPAWADVQRKLQYEASNDHEEQTPEGFTSTQWKFYYSYVSQSGLALYRAWVASGKTIPVQEAADIAAETVASGAKTLLKHLGLQV